MSKQNQKLLTREDVKQEILETIGPIFEELKHGQQQGEKRLSSKISSLDSMINGVGSNLGSQVKDLRFQMNEMNTKIDMVLENLNILPNHEKRISDLEQNMNVVKLVIKRPKS
jgi:DNA-binding transcriptional regulator GbsR (MarR family)